MPGVTITVSNEDGEVGSVETGTDGAWEISVPGPGEYEVVLDTETLPDDVPGVVADTITTNVNPLRTKRSSSASVSQVATATVAVRRRERRPKEAPIPHSPAKIWQLVASGLRFGLILGLAALGLSLVFGTTGLTNFAHGELVTFGALVAWWLNNAGLPVIAAAALAVVRAACSGGRRTSGSGGRCASAALASSRMMIISIGVSLLLRYFYLYLLRRRAAFIRPVHDPGRHRLRARSAMRRATCGSWGSRL